MSVARRFTEKPSPLPPLTDDERYQFMDDWIGGETAGKLRALPTDAEALRWLTWQRDNGGGGGPSGWAYEVVKKGRVACVLSVVPAGAEPNQYGVYMGVPVRSAVIAFDAIVCYLRHGRPTAQQLSLF